MLKKYDSINVAGRTATIGSHGVIMFSGETQRPHCTLVLTGTSTQIADVRYFIRMILKHRSSVAAIERCIGSPFVPCGRPAIERSAILMDFIYNSYHQFGIETIDMVAHSYAAQEVVRALDGRPADALPRIGGIALINPSGFGNTRGFFSHCLRFVFLFILSDYWRNFKALNDCKRVDPTIQADCRRVMHGLFTLAVKTIANPVRTIQEVADIVSCDLRPALRRLVPRDGWRMVVFLSDRDTLVSAARTRRFFHDELPWVRCVDLPGNHLDPVLRKGLVNIVLKTILEEWG